MRLLFILFFVVLLIGVLPAWPYSGGWGYLPGGAVLLLLVIGLIALFSRRGDVV